MANLSLTNAEILKALALVMGVDRDPGEWDQQTQDDARAMIRSGMRAFFNPLDGDRAHTWRFLERTFAAGAAPAYETGTVTVSGSVATLAGGTWPSWAADCVLSVDGQRLFVAARTSDTVLALQETAVAAPALSTYSLYRYRHPLPADFGEFIGGVTYQRANLSRTLRSTTNTDIRLKYAVNMRTDDSLYYTIQAGSDIDAADWYIEYWPVMGTEAAIAATYRASPEDNLDDSNLEVDGTLEQVGAVHAGTLLAAILAAAEEYYNDRPGTHAEKFQRLLAASIKHDLATAGPIGTTCPKGVDARRLSLLKHNPTYDTI